MRARQRPGASSTTNNDRGLEVGTNNDRGWEAGDAASWQVTASNNDARGVSEAMCCGEAAGKGQSTTRGHLFVPTSLPPLRICLPN